MNENATAGAPRAIDRRTVVKGAAWSVPAIAAAVAMPLASASGETKTPALRIYADCLLNALDVKIGQGFYVENAGTGDYAGNITVVETITLSGAAAAPLVRDAVWLILLVQGVLGGNTAGVTRGNWGVVNSGNGITTPFKSVATRTVTISGPLAAGETRSWGILANVASGVINALGLLGLAGLQQSASITVPTGNPPVTKASDTMNWELLSTSC
ncbi:hypothetical protein ACTJJ4_07035 [Microbacterium sp. 22195]|uniref:hypothetical protein n=1 Tax=Microbacterium sp. 22195 TaxID=3453891 RepID=UPI003F84ECB4